MVDARLLHGLPGAAVELMLSPQALVQPLPELFGALIGALRDRDGVPVDRASCSVPTLHPEMRSVQLVWTNPLGEVTSGGGVTEGGGPPSVSKNDVVAVPRTYAAVTSPMFARSPMRPLYEGRASVIREHILPGPAGRTYEILDELAEEGFSDYLATITQAENPWERAPLTWATRHPGGFSDEHVEGLLGLVPLLTLLLAMNAQRTSTRSLLATYLGADAASRVLDGHIRRGDVVDIEAAVCFCDLRNFTTLSQELSQADLLDLLDDAFEAVVTAVEAEQGDVLKFIGDAVLAVFRVDPTRGPADAVARAYRAGQDTLRRVRETSDTRVAAGKSPLEMGLSVHLGRVAYGNIGGPRRLDFTVIGAAVNLASRLEGMCRTLGHPMVMSDDAARHLADVSLFDTGSHALKGIPAPVRIWGAPLAPPRARH